MKYFQKLRDPRWQRKRLDILERDGFQCQMCADKKEELQVHHKQYKRGKEPWEYDNNELEVLCSTCHFITTYYNREAFLILKTRWVTKQTRVVLFYSYVGKFYSYVGKEAKTIVLKLNFNRKTVRELSRIPVNLKPLND